MDVKSRIIRCQKEITRFDFYFALHLGYKFYSLTDNLSKSLQSSTLSAVAAQRLARLKISTIESMRNDEFAKLYFDYLTKCASQHTLIEESKLDRKRRKPNYATLQIIDGFESNAEIWYSENILDKNCVMYFEVADITPLKDRFEQETFHVY